MNGNPWQVDSIEAFIFLKCPECTLFFTKDEDIFQLHANEYHPLSVVFFGKALDETKHFYDPLETEECDNNETKDNIEDFRVNPKDIENEMLHTVKSEMSETLSEIDENSSPKRCIFLRFSYPNSIF